MPGGQSSPKLAQRRPKACQPSQRAKTWISSKPPERHVGPVAYYSDSSPRPFVGRCCSQHRRRCRVPLMLVVACHLLFTMSLDGGTERLTGALGKSTLSEVQPTCRGPSKPVKMTHFNGSCTSKSTGRL